MVERPLVAGHQVNRCRLFATFRAPQRCQHRAESSVSPFQQHLHGIHHDALGTPTAQLKGAFGPVRQMLREAESWRVHRIRLDFVREQIKNAVSSEGSIPHVQQG